MTHWRRSKRSGTGGQSNCVEVADLADSIGVRDSKAPNGPHITLPADQFRELAAAIKHGVHDMP